MLKRWKINTEENYRTCYKAKNANLPGLAFFDLLLPNGKMSTV